MYNTRKEAQTAGALTYMTGVPCPYGHVDVRYTKTGQCKSCVRESSRKSWVNKSGKTRKRWTQCEMVAAFCHKHDNLYDYSDVHYTRHKDLVQINCAKHGPFFMTPDNHLQGKGCPSCKHAAFGERSRGTKKSFLASASAVWGERWDYSQFEYAGAHKQGTILCREHGPFLQSPTNHLTAKVGCTRCNHMKSSQEDAIADFLSKFTPVVRRSRKIIAPKELDIYLPGKQLAVEYCGMFWHSHFDVDNERANRHNHANKYKACAEQGIRLLTIYESEWLERQPQIKRLLRNAVGASRGKLMARKCDLRLTSPQEARAFFDRYHPQGGDGHGEHYGLYWKDKLVACMRFAYGHNDRGHGAKTRYWTLGRFATRINVAGAASRLFKAFIDNVNPDEVKSFSDNRFFSGAMYEALGFVLEEEIAPDYQVWSPKAGLRPKPHYQRRALPKRLLEHAVDDVFDPDTDPRTEAQMTYLMACGRIYDCGKKRWVWRK